MHLLILLIYSFCTCILLSSFVFTLFFEFAPIFFNATDFFINNYLIGCSFCILCSNFVFQINHKFNRFSFVIVFLVMYVEICTPDRYFRLPGAPKVVFTSSADCTGNEKQSVRVSTTCHSMAKVVIAFYSRYRAADVNSISAVS